MNNKIDPRNLALFQAARKTRRTSAIASQDPSAYSLSAAAIAFLEAERRRMRWLQLELPLSEPEAFWTFDREDPRRKR